MMEIVLHVAYLTIKEIVKTIQLGLIKMPRMLDLFAGSQSVYRIFRESGYDVTAVDILWGQDIMTWEPDGYYDFVWASPPCDTYTDVPWHQVPVDLTLWKRTLDIIGMVRPQYYVIENVRGAQRYWGKAVKRVGSRYLWGVFPTFDVKDGKDLYGKSRLPPSPDRKMLRSMIPERLTRSLVEALMSQERTD